jgi:hypothetical protein
VYGGRWERRGAEGGCNEEADHTGSRDRAPRTVGLGRSGEQGRDLHTRWALLHLVRRSADLFPETGSTLRFEFLNPNEDGTIPFRLEPEGVSLAPIPLPSGGTLTYRLAAPTIGTMRPTAEGRKIEFTAAVAAILDAPEGSGSYNYAVPFTTEVASASNVQHTDTLTITGMRLVNGVWYAQIVGATTNKENAYPAPGAAVTTVLSGSFDQVP